MTAKTLGIGQLANTGFPWGYTHAPREWPGPANSAACGALEAALQVASRAGLSLARAAPACALDTDRRAAAPRSPLAVTSDVPVTAVSGTWRISTNHFIAGSAAVTSNVTGESQGCALVPVTGRLLAGWLALPGVGSAGRTIPGPPQRPFGFWLRAG